MVSLSPFIGLRPVDDVVERTIDGALRNAARLARRRHHPRQVAWLEATDRGETADADDWLAEGALVVDDHPSLRVVEQVLPSGQRVLGVLGVAQLADLVPHEGTDPAAVRRRVDRDRRQQVETRPLLAVLPTDPPVVRAAIATVLSAPPELDILDEHGVGHRVWRCDVPTGETLADGLSGVPCLLADGHHRVAAASMAGRRDAMALVTLAGAPPTMLPVHRIVAVPRGRDGAVHAWLDDLPAGETVRVHFRGRTCSTGGDAVALPVEVAARTAFAVPGLARVTTSADPHVVAVAERDGAVVVSSAAPTVTDVLSAVAAGRPLPPKSTAFAPKPRVGLTMRRVPVTDA